MRLSGFALPISRLSATALGIAMTCPEQYRRRYLLHEPERLNTPQLIGRAMHAALDSNWQWKLQSGEDLEEESVWSAYQHAWRQTIEEEGEPEWKETPDELLHTSELMLGAYMDEVAPRMLPLNAELYFEERFPGIPVPVVGYIDLETKDLIREVKTTDKKVSSAKPNWRLQARIYQMVLRKPVEHQIVTRQVTPKVYTIENEPGLLTKLTNPDSTLVLMQRVVHQMNDLYCRHGADSPWPANGVLHPFACNYCSYRNSCYAWNGAPPHEG